MARTAGALLAGLLLALLPAARAADAAAPEGTWKVLLPFLPQTRGEPLWLLKLEKKDGKWTGKITASGAGALKADVKKVGVADGRLRFTLELQNLSLPCEVRLPKDKDKADALYGTATTPRGVTAVELQRTTITDLDTFSLAKENLARHPAGHDGLKTALGLLQLAGENKAKPEEVRSWAAKAYKMAGDYGPRWQEDIGLDIAQGLSEQKQYAPIALEYARKAERTLEPKTPPARQQRVLETLAKALTAAGKDKEADEVKARIKKIDFSIKTKAYAGRKGKSESVVLVELFTGAQCPPCVAADMAFDALDKTFKPSEVILLQYHLHIPGPDPLTTPAGLERAEFYGRDIRGTPTVFFNGRAGAPGGGQVADASDKYTDYLTVIEPLLEKPAGARLKLSARRKGDKLTIKAEASGVEQEGDEIVLRLVLVEEQMDYTGSNKLAHHRHVVRAFLGGAKGRKVAKGKTVARAITADLAEIRKEIKDYLDKFAKKTPFPGKEPSLALKNLKVVAFVQNDETRAVLQAAQVSVKDE